MELPLTAGSWVVLIVGVLTALTIIVTAVVKLGNAQIDARIRKTLATTVRTAIEDALLPLEVHLEAMRLQLVTQDGELARVRRIEAKIENGLMHRQVRIEDKVDRLLEHQGWDGVTERRV